MQVMVKRVIWQMEKRHAKTKASAVSEDTWKPPALDWSRVHWLWSYYYTRRVKEAIHVRLCMLQHKLDIGVDIPETWMRTTRNTKHNNFATVESDRTFSQSVPSRPVWDSSQSQSNRVFHKVMHIYRPYNTKKTQYAVKKSQSTSKVT